MKRVIVLYRQILEEHIDTYIVRLTTLSRCPCIKTAIGNGILLAVDVSKSCLYAMQTPSYKGGADLLFYIYIYIYICINLCVLPQTILLFLQTLLSHPQGTAFFLQFLYFFFSLIVVSVCFSFNGLCLCNSFFNSSLCMFVL